MSRRTFLEAIDASDEERVRAELADHSARASLKLDSPASKYKGRTSLTLALERGNPEIVQLLLDAGASPDKPDGLYDDPIFLAVAHPKCLRLLLAAGAQVDAVGEDYITPLMCAVAWPESVRILLDAGADPEARSREAETALYFAARDGHQESVEILSARMAPEFAKKQLEWAERSRPWMERSEEDRPLHALRIAMKMGTPESVRELARTIPLEAPEGEESPLIAAVGCDCVEAVEILLDRGADPNDRTAGGVPAVLFAVEQRSVEIVRRLVAAGADVEAPSHAARHDGAGARQYAGRWGSAEMQAALEPE